MNGEKILIKCVSCCRRFPLNPRKHRRDKHIYCPFCHAENVNPRFEGGILQRARWWLRQKLERCRKKKEAEEVLQRYFATPVIDSSGRVVKWNYTFPLRKWLAGQRPTISVEEIVEVVGDDPIAIEEEIAKLERLGVNVKR